MSYAKRMLEAAEDAAQAARVQIIRAALAAFPVPRDQLVAVIRAECCECENSAEVDELLDDWRTVCPAEVALVEAERWGGK